MPELRFVMGIDSSTQGTSAVLLDRESFETAAQARVRYRDDPRLAGYGLGGGAPILPPREKGEADQPAALYLDALDALFETLGPALLGQVAAVNISAQQHGQVWLGARGAAAIRALRAPGADASLRSAPNPGGSAGGLAGRIGPGLSSERAPIWMSANTAAEARALRAAAWGAASGCTAAGTEASAAAADSEDARRAMAALSGSDSPLRFSGAVLRHKALRCPAAYAGTERFHLISSFLSGVLAGDPDAPIDWGNGSGTSLMDYKARSWSPLLVAACAQDLPGGAAFLAGHLPRLAHPLSIIGTIAAYFVERYGFRPECAIVAGSGDNPQSRVLAENTLLSLGTSFVLMTEGSEPYLGANAMYDGTGRPFLFGCRTNGALSWEARRLEHGCAADDFGRWHRALSSLAPGSALRIVQTERESFPESERIDEAPLGSLEADCCAAVDADLGLMALASAPFAGHIRRLEVTGGAAREPEVLRRAAAIWNALVLPIANAGAGSGAALAAALALAPEEERDALARRGRAAAAHPGSPVGPRPEDVAAYHGQGGYLERLRKRFELETGRRL